MGLWRGMALFLSFMWSLTACTGFPVGTARIESSGRSAFPGALQESSMRLTAQPVSASFGSSTLRLSKNGGGSISIHSDGRSVSLLQGLDPTLVNPAVLPFLFPSCTVPVSSAMRDEWETGN